MSDETQQNPIMQMRVVHQIPGMDAVTVQRDVEYRLTGAGSQTMDVYRPPDAGADEPRPAVVFVSGYADSRMQEVFGCRPRDTGAATSWARLVAASGMVAITYSTEHPAEDLPALLHFVRQNSGALGIDDSRLGVWAASGNVPMALSILMQEASASFRCAALCYGFTLDLGGFTSVADAAAQFGFVNACAGKTVADLPQELPLFIVRAGQDTTPQLNESLDLFVAQALARNLPVTFANHAAAQHAFDLLDHSETSREMVRMMLAFLRFHLLAQPPRDR